MVKKHILDTDNVLWKRVQLFRLTDDQPNINEALLVLIKRGLEFTDVLAGRQNQQQQQQQQPPPARESTSAKVEEVRRGPGRPPKNRHEEWSQEHREKVAAEMRAKYGIEIPDAQAQEHRPITA